MRGNRQPFGQRRREGTSYTVARTGLAYKLVAAQAGLDVQIGRSAFVDAMCRSETTKERTARRNKSERQQRERQHDESPLGAKGNMLFSMREREKLFLW
jgi:hypothetical protein